MIMGAHVRGAVGGPRARGEGLPVQLRRRPARPDRADVAPRADDVGSTNNVGTESGVGTAGKVGTVDGVWSALPRAGGGEAARRGPHHQADAVGDAVAARLPRDGAAKTEQKSSSQSSVGSRSPVIRRQIFSNGN